jgi:hypothetical protein
MWERSGVLVSMLWIFIHDRQNVCHYVCLLVSSSAYDHILVYMFTPFLNHIPFFRGSSLSLYTHPVCFSLLPLCPDGTPWIWVGWCENMDSRELPGGGWISCIIVGHLERLQAHCVPRVLDTWGHDHQSTPSLLNESEDFRVPDQSSLGRVGV